MNSYHWAQGIIDFLHNGSQVLHLTPWVVGGWKCIPRCSFNLQYLHSQPLRSGEGWEAWWAGVPTFLNVLRPLLLTYLLIPLSGLGLTFLIFSGRMPTAPLLGPDHEVREEHRASPHEIHINIITTLSEFTVAMSTKQLGKLGNEVGFGNMAMFPSLRTIGLWHQPAFSYLPFLLLIYGKTEKQSNSH